MNQSKPKSNRKTYLKPEIVAYGSLKDLTTGGTGIVTEAMMAAAPMKQIRT